MAEAIANPKSAELNTLWELLMEALAPLPQRQQFEIAGDVILKMADILARRAQMLLNNETPEPAELSAQRLTRELIDPFTRSMQFNASNFMKAKPPRKSRKRAIAPSDSIVGEVDKATLIAVVEQEAAQAIVELSHEEAISEWGQQLQPYLRGQSLPLVELGDRSNMPLVQVWMTALLNAQFELRQTGEFYQRNGVVVCVVD
ncbi:hypothetical protein [Vacuolonema iberomarrocanum]|uniref:hypothetical protein n=1 Tax=Vacuolonema iberomarrocanum TaxID=3454632 RepID=UPI0019F795AF|nr:hypothetical protein [filamentous cyanobacterium LEGE 07170]